eukprot:scaffold14.g1290.t1
MLRLLGLGKERWRWPIGKPRKPPTAVLSAAARALGAGQAGAAREAVLTHWAAVVDPVSNPAGAAAASAAVVASAGAGGPSDVLAAVSAAMRVDARPSDAALIAAAALAAHVGSGGPAAAGAVAGSGLLTALLTNCAGFHAGTEARVAVVSAVRRLVQFTATRRALDEGQGVATLVAALRTALGPAAASGGCVGQPGEQELGLAAEAAWALELLAGLSRRMCSLIGDEGGVEAALRLLQAALRSRPALAELPRAGAAVAAAANGLHALLALASGSRRNRLRLRDAGGAAVLAEAFADPQLPWEAREQAAGLLEDLAGTLTLDEGPLPPPGAASGSQAGSLAGGAGAGASGAAAAQLAEWQWAVLPALAGVLRARRGPGLQESKAAAAAVVARLAESGEAAAAAAAAAGVLPPLAQLLQVCMQLAGGDRATALVVLGALRSLAPANRDALLAVRLGAHAAAGGSGGGRQVGVLDLLQVLMEDASAAADEGLVFGAGQGLAIAYGSSEVVRAGWRAAAVAAALCTGNHAAQDAAAARGLLPSLLAYLAVDAPAAAPARARAGAWLGATAAAADDGREEALGELPDTDRPLLTYTPAQLAAMLQAQGIDASRFLDRGVTGAEFVGLSDAELRALSAAAQLPRVLRVLRAWEAFREVESAAGPRDGAVSLGKLVAYLSARGFRVHEVVPLAEELLQLMDGDRDDRVPFPDFLPCFEEFCARTLAEEQPPSKRRRTTGLA